MLFTLTAEQRDICPKVIVDVVSIQHGKIGLSVYHCVQNEDSFRRANLLADQSFTIRRVSALSPRDIEDNIQEYFRAQRRIALRDQEHPELCDLCEKLVAKYSSLDTTKFKNIHSKLRDIEETLNNSCHSEIDYDTIRTNLLDMEDDMTSS